MKRVQYFFAIKHDTLWASAIILCFLINFAPLCSFSQSSWTGSKNTAWSNALNWTNGVPSVNDDAIIGDDSFTGNNHPIIESATACKSLVVGVGNNKSRLVINNLLTINKDIIIGPNGFVQNDNNITIKGNWTVNGQYASKKNSVVHFNGNDQDINGTVVFNRLIIDEGSRTILKATISVQKEFMIYGYFDPGTNSVNLGSSLFKVNSKATIKVNAISFSQNYSKNPVLDPESVVDYASTATNQNIEPLNYGTLKITGGTVKTLLGTIELQSSKPSVGNVDIVKGTLNITSQILKRGSTTPGGRLSIMQDGVLIMKDLNGFPTSFKTVEINNLIILPFEKRAKDLMASGGKEVPFQIVPDKSYPFGVESSLILSNRQGTSLSFLYTDIKYSNEGNGLYTLNQLEKLIEQFPNNTLVKTGYRYVKGKNVYYAKLAMSNDKSEKQLVGIFCQELNGKIVYSILQTSNIDSEPYECLSHALTYSFQFASQL